MTEPERVETTSGFSPTTRWAIAIYAVVTVIFLITAQPFVTRDHTPYNHFALLADSWLHGRLDLGGPPPAYTGNNDFAQYDGKYYVSFPPFPALLIAPLVALMGSPERVRDGLFFVMFSGIGPAALFLALEKLSALKRSRRTRMENAGLALLFAFGTVYWFSAVQGTVWFAAHVVGVALACLYILASIEAEHPILAGLALGLGFATRTPLGFAFPFFFYEALFRRAPKDAPIEQRLRDPATVRRLVAFAAPAAAILAVLLWMNKARFGSATEFGHRYLAIVWRPRIEKWGLFSFHYLGRNLAVVLTSMPFTRSSPALFQVNAHGLALWITSPFFLYALWPKSPKPQYWALVATTVCVAVPSLLYQNSGWVQFGYRFSNDFAPFIIVLIALSRRELRAAFGVLAAFAIAVNGFGALTFQRAGSEKYYFIDNSQRILHEPD